MKENIEYLIGSAVALIGIVVAYFKSNPKARTVISEISTKFFNRISGQKNEDNFNETKIMLTKLSRSVEIMNKKVDSNQSIVLGEIAEINNKIEKSDKISQRIYEKNKEEHTKVFVQLKILTENQKVETNVLFFSRELRFFFNEFIDDKNLNKNLIDVLEEGVKASIDFVRIILINNGLANLDISKLTNAIKSSFRTLQQSNIYECLNLEDLDTFKSEIEEEIVKPLLSIYLTKFISAQNSFKGADLVEMFLSINLEFSKNVIKKTTFLFENKRQTINN